MSPSTSTTIDRLAEDLPVEELGERTTDVRRYGLPTPLQAVAFWTAVALPLSYAPLVFGGVTATEAPLLLGLLVANVLAFALGHGHDADA